MVTNENQQTTDNKLKRQIEPIIFGFHSKTFKYEKNGQLFIEITLEITTVTIGLIMLNRTHDTVTCVP